MSPKPLLVQAAFCLKSSDDGQLRRAEQIANGGGGRARSHPFSIALGRFVTTEEIAGAVDYLWSPDGTSITGATPNISAG